MDSSQKLVFVLQHNRLQGLIWQSLLRSQNLSVILESAGSDLTDCISQIAIAGLTLPDVLILDAETPGLNPYEFCRWCRDTYPGIQVFLTRSRTVKLSETEQRWALHQGATGFLDGFQRDTLMSNAATNVKRILAALEHPFLDERALLSVLLTIRRRLEATHPVMSPPAADPTASAPPSDLKGAVSNTRWMAKYARKSEDPSVPAAVNSNAHAAKLPLRNASTPDSPATAEAETGQSVRRYRGVAY